MLTPLRIWERSKGLAIGLMLTILAMVGVVIGTAVDPHGTFAVFAPNFFWGLAGVLVGISIATDVLTRTHESDQRRQP